jgi:hypothetical protein
MIWFTWRQFRTQTWIAIGAVAVMGVLLALAAGEIAHVYASSGLASCQVDCETLAQSFLRRLEDSIAVVGYASSPWLIYATPALIGVFWGAPLIARELETGTVRLAWNQSVTRSRWLATKLIAVGALGIATAGLLSLVATWSLRTVDQFADARIAPALFGARGIVAIGYAAFAFMLGVTLGLVIRRTVPAMAATLAVYVGTVVVMMQWVRERLAPVSHLTRAVDTDHVYGLMIYGDTNTMTVIGEGELPGAWVLANRTITASGQEFTGPADPTYCGDRPGPMSCLDWVGTLGLRQDLTYHPAEQFWRLQLTETGLFLVLALLLAAFCFWWLRSLRA